MMDDEAHDVPATPLRQFFISPIEPRDQDAWVKSDYADLCSVFAKTGREARELAAREFDAANFESSPWLDAKHTECRDVTSSNQLPFDISPGVQWIPNRRPQQSGQ